jgi:putative transposase
MTPTDVHDGRVDAVIAARQGIRDDFYRRHPQRFRKPPRAPRLPEAVWINKLQEVMQST